MGKILFFADVHGNMPAARALEKEIERIKPDDIWFLGDAVGKGPENAQAVDWVRTHSKHFVKGNWDDGICRDYKERQWPDSEFFWKQLGEERIKWLEGLPLEDEVLIGGWWFRLIHGRPVDRLYQAYDDWDERRIGFSVALTKRIFDDFTSLSGGYLFEHVKVDEMTHGMSEKFTKWKGGDFVGRIFLTLERDTRNSVTNPTDGYYVSASASVTTEGLGASNNYYKWELLMVEVKKFRF